MSFSVEKAKELIENREYRLKKLKERMAKIRSMSFIKQMQQPENIKKLKNMEEYHKEVFLKKLKENFRRHYDKRDELFAHYWTMLLNEKIKNMFEFWEQIDDFV